VVWSDVDISQDQAQKATNGYFLKEKKESVQNRAKRSRRKQVWCRKVEEIN
jgi:hypothetical protein